MTTEQKLRLLELSSKYTVSKTSDGYEVASKYADLVAKIDKTEDVTYYVSGVYNSGSDYAEINIDIFMDLIDFVELLKQDKEG